MSILKREYSSGKDKTQCCNKEHLKIEPHVLNKESNEFIFEEDKKEDDGNYYFLFTINANEPKTLYYKSRKEKDVYNCDTGEIRLFKHPCVSGGVRTLTAGVLVVDELHKKIIILPDSGHYRPDDESTKIAESILKDTMQGWTVERDTRKIGDGLYVKDEFQGFFEDGEDGEDGEGEEVEEEVEEFVRGGGDKRQRSSKRRRTKKRKSKKRKSKKRKSKKRRSRKNKTRNKKGDHVVRRRGPRGGHRLQHARLCVVN